MSDESIETRRRVRVRSEADPESRAARATAARADRRSGRPGLAGCARVRGDAVAAPGRHAPRRPWACGARTDIPSIAGVGPVGQPVAARQREPVARDQPVAPLETDAPSSTPVASPTGDPVLVGAGDIGQCGSDGDEDTAALLDAIAGTVFTAGDNAYENGTARAVPRMLRAPAGAAIAPGPGRPPGTTTGRRPGSLATSAISATPRRVRAGRRGIRTTSAAGT